MFNSENTRAVGVKTLDGKTYNADYVISAVDMHHTITELLKNFSTPSASLKKIESNPVFPSLIQVSLGCKRTFNDISHKIQMQLDNTLQISNRERLSDMMVRFCHFDPSSHRKVLHQLSSTSTENYQYWSLLRKDNFKEYIAQKKNRTRSYSDTGKTLRKH